MADAEKDAVAETESHRSQTDHGMAQAAPFPGLPTDLAVAKDCFLKLEDVRVGSTNSVAGGQAIVHKRLMAKDPKKEYLPGQPLQPLNSTAATDANRDLFKYLHENHATEDLDDLLRWMRWIFVGDLSSLEA
jgi:hypothetical protein